MPKLIALTDFPYAHRSMKKGEEFEASERDASVLKLTKRAADAKRAVVETRQLSLEGEKPSDDQQDAGQSRRGRYARRDMRSQT